MPFQTGLDPTKAETPASALQPQEQQSLCVSRDQNIQANLGFDKLAYINCLQIALLVGGNESGCKTQMSKCMSEAAPAVSLDARLADERSCINAVHGCTTQVKELEECITANVELAFDILHNWSCAHARDPAARDAAARAIKMAAACAAGKAACASSSSTSSRSRPGSGPAVVLAAHSLRG